MQSFAKMKSNTFPLQPKERTCCQVFWAIFPRACFICSLVIYALLGAVIFSHVEGCRDSHEGEAYRSFMLKLWNLSKDLSGKINCTKYIKWSFLGSLFFCCTVFTTVGYDHIYPVMRLGKCLCMVYALFGVPLMFLVLTDMGDILATILSTSYNRARKLQSKVLARLSFRSCCKKSTDSKGGLASLGPAKIVLLEPLNIKDALKNNYSFKKKSGKNQNVEIFESSINNIGKEVEQLDVPFSLMTFIVFAYISCTSTVLPHWEKALNFEEAFYFCFITLTTIGFGDIKLQHPNFFLFFLVYIIVRMEIVITAFKLGQDRILCLYKNLLFCIGQKKVSDKNT
uniref:Potassium two pore domain channel subfamily K member 18 n=1 Tax=Laticauda laticaudata TaxID=8630 RepID=A0A8C5RWP2_LATLA